MTAPVTGQERTEPTAVDTIVTGEWIITLNADREIYRDGAIAVSGGVITEVGKRSGRGVTPYVAVRAGRQAAGPRPTIACDCLRAATRSPRPAFEPHVRTCHPHRTRWSHEYQQRALRGK